MNGSKLSAKFFVSSDTVTEVKEQQKIIFKGENTLEDVHNTDPNNVFGEDKPKYDRNETLANLKVLRKYADINIRKLDKDTVAKFYSVLKTERLLQNEPTLREMFLGDVKKIFGDLKTAEPGTPGALFIKCNGTFECDPSCETSIFKEKNNCNKRVLHYSTTNCQFSNLNDIKSSDVCIIYVDTKKNTFKGFTSTDIQLLTSHGCNNYILIFKGYDNKAPLDQYSVTPISDLPKMQNEPLQSALNIQNNLNNAMNGINLPNVLNKIGTGAEQIVEDSAAIVNSIHNDTAAFFGKPFIVLIVIIILLILIVLFAYYSSQNQKKEYYLNEY